jgi:multisubunit Na+/H+ antiporter MnhC subunit
MIYLFVFILFIIGLYCVLFTFNLIRLLIGLELMIKGATLLIINAGYEANHLALSSAMVITLIVIEVVVMVVAAGVILGLYSYHKSLNTKNVKLLKG